MSLSAYPTKNYCASQHTRYTEYTPSKGYYAYRRVNALSGTGFEYLNPRSLAIRRPGDMGLPEPSGVQMKYDAVCRRVREKSTSRSRSTISSDRWSVNKGDISDLSTNPDLKLARKRMSYVDTSGWEEYPPVRARSNQYEQLTYNLINYGAMRKHV